MSLISFKIIGGKESGGGGEGLEEINQTRLTKH